MNFDEEDAESDLESEFIYSGYGCKTCGQKTSGKKNYCIDHLLDNQPYVKEICALIAVRSTEEREAEKAWETFKLTHSVPQLNEGILVSEILKYLSCHRDSAATFTLIKENLDITPAAMHGFLEYLKKQEVLQPDVITGSTEIKYRLTIKGRTKVDEINPLKAAG